MKGNRKILMGILVMAVGVAVDALAKNGLTVNLMELLKYIALGFFGGNAVEHAARAYNNGGGPISDETAAVIIPNDGDLGPIPQQPAADLSEINQKLDQISLMSTEANKGISLANQGVSYVVGFIQKSGKNN